MSYKERQARQKAEREAERRKAPPAPPRRHVCDEDCEHYRSPLELEIQKAIAEVLKRMVPQGARAVAGYEPVRYCSPAYVKLVCSGSIPIMAYDCCLKPNHSGQCYSATKSVHFTPERSVYLPES